MRRSLTLTRESLLDLTTDELLAVQGANAQATDYPSQPCIAPTEEIRDRIKYSVLCVPNSLAC